MHSKIILAASLFLTSLPAVAQNVGIGNNNPVFPLDITGRVRLRTGIGSAGFFLNSDDNTQTPAFIGMRYDSLVGFYGNTSGWRFVMNTNTGNIGLGDFNPTSPLSFPASLGKKISLYKGTTGDAGFSVLSNELRIHSDYNNADITFGYDDFSKGFTELMRIKGNGSVGIGTSTPNTSASLDLSATAKPMILPRLTTIQRNQLNNLETGMTIYNTFTDCIETVRNNNKWWNFCNNQYSETLGIGTTYGGDNLDIVNSAKATSDGGIIACGYTQSYHSGTFNSLTYYGLYDGIIIKFDSTGAISWQHSYGGNSYDKITDITPTSDGGYIICGNSATSNNGLLTGIPNNGGIDGWILKVDANGTIQWQKLLGGADADEINGIIQMSDGTYLCAGYTNSSNTGTLSGLTSFGLSDGWIVKLDATGNVVWQQNYGGSNTDNFLGLKNSEDANIYVVGKSNSSADGTFTGITSNGNYDGWALKINASNGAIIWQKLLGGTNDEELSALTPGNNGGLLITGFTASQNTGTLTGQNFFGGLEMLVIKLSATGSTEWQNVWGTNGNDRSMDCIATADGGYTIAGESSGFGGTLQSLTTYGNTDCWILHCNNTGSIIWQKIAGGSQTETSRKIVPFSNNRTALFAGTVSTDFNLDGLLHFGFSDIWRLVLDQSGNFLYQ